MSAAAPGTWFVMPSSNVCFARYGTNIVQVAYNGLRPCGLLGGCTTGKDKGEEKGAVLV